MSNNLSDVPCIYAFHLQINGIEIILDIFIWTYCEFLHNWSLQKFQNRNYTNLKTRFVKAEYQK